MNPIIADAIQQAVRKHGILINDLTEQQTCEAFKQALLAGDFKRLITTDGKQQVVYLPYSGVEDLRRENERLRELLSEIYLKLLREQLTKAELASLVKIARSHFDQAQYDQGVAWGLYLATTLILQEQLEHQNGPPCAANDVLRHPVESLGSKPAP